MFATAIHSTPRRAPGGIDKISVMAYRSWQLGLMAGLSMVPLFAQQRTPTFQSSTTLVEVTAVVRNGQGKAIGDLTVEDFRLFDAGKRQTISSFRIEKLRRANESSRQPAAAAETSPALPDRFIAFVLDDQNLVPEHFPNATLAAIHYLPELRPGDRAAVVTTSGHTILPFTGDRDKLREAFSHMVSLNRRATFDVSGLNSEISCKITYLKADWIVNGDPSSLQNCVAPAWKPPQVQLGPQRPGTGLTLAPPGEAHQIFLENQVRAFAESIVQAGDRDVQSYFLGLARLIGAMSHMPGERSIVLLSPGMYIPPRLRNLQDWTIRNALRAGVVLSGIDPRGVYIRNDPDDPSTMSDAWGLAETQERFGFMENVTSGTGGTFLRGDNDIQGAIRRIDSTPEFVYVLGFSPTQLKLDGKLHPLKVTLNRQRGLSVKARSGYYAVEKEPDETARRQQRMQDAFFSEHQVHDVAVELRVRSSHKPNTSIVLTAIAEIGLSNVPFRKDGPVNRSDLTMVVGIFDQNGNLVKDFWKDITLHPSDESLAALRRSGLELTTDFDVPPGRYFVRLLVRENEGQAMGTHSTSVEIRP